MNLIIDEGNSFIKVAIYNGKEQRFFKSFEKDDFFENTTQITDFQYVTKCIISSVGNEAKERFSFLKNHIPYVCFLHQKSPMPFTNCYATPHTLGIDRMALMAGASLLFPKKNVLVIDAGTCITFDIMTENQEYLGGAIAPGIAMRLKAMHEFTAKLPLISEQNFDIENFIGNSTETCILSGVYHNISCEIEGVIGRYKEKFKNLTIILTGGSHIFLEKNIKNCTFANSFFLLESLNALLEFQKERF